MTGSDSMDRYYCHIKEMYQSLDIIEQLIDNIPEGDFYIKQKPIIKVPEGQWYFSVEGASGVVWRIPRLGEATRVRTA